MINEGFDLAYDTETSSVFNQSPISEAANNRIMQTRRDSINNQAKMSEVLMSLPPLGLKLHKPTSFMNLIETKLFPEERQNLSTETNLKKASNADIFILKIGTWQRVAQNKEDLVAKCYFGKRKLMWEIMEKGLKRKIQMHWEHILAIRAEIDENRPGILEIELSQPPSFFRETEPQPRKHTLWDNASDFTGGQAMICRRHLLQFPPGALDKLYEKLLQCETRFFQMSQRPFPSLQSPYFESDFYNIGCSDISFGYNENTLQNHYSTGLMGQEFQMICNQSSDYSPTSVMDLSQPLGQRVGIENESISNMAHWGQHVDNCEEMEQRGVTQDRFSISLEMNRNYEDELVINDQRSLPMMMMGNESQFMNYSGVEVEMNCANYEQESVGSENTESSFYPQCVNWVEEEEVNKLAYTTNFGLHQTMTHFIGNQNSVCPWM